MCVLLTASGVSWWAGRISALCLSAGATWPGQAGKVTPHTLRAELWRSLPVPSGACPRPLLLQGPCPPPRCCAVELLACASCTVLGAGLGDRNVRGSRSSYPWGKGRTHDQHAARVWPCSRVRAKGYSPWVGVFIQEASCPKTCVLHRVLLGSCCPRGFHSSDLPLGVEDASRENVQGPPLRRRPHGGTE